MSDPMKILILIALCCVNGFLLLSVFKGTRRKAVVPTDRTVIIPLLYLDQLDPQNLNRVHRTYNLTRDLLCSTGMAISRAGCARGDIFLDCTFNETTTVGEEHAVVAMDAQGIFIQNNHEANGMQLLVDNKRNATNEVEIADGMILYLGNQPIRFRFPNIQPTTRTPVWEKPLRVLRMLLGNLIGFSRKNTRRAAPRRSDRGDW